MVDDVLRRGNRFYRPPAGDAFMPIEFGAAAYRFGHSMVRPSYRANFTSGTGDSTTRPPIRSSRWSSTPTSRTSATRSTTTATTCSAATRRRGATSAGRRSSTSATARSRTTRRSTPRSPACCSRCRCRRSRRTPRPRPTRAASAKPAAPAHLGLPSGQAIAPRWASTRWRRADLSDIAAVYGPFGTSTPLWYYILAEAKTATGGLHLGPVGGRIVAETLIGLLRADPTSYLSVHPRFRPFLGTDLDLGPTPNPTITGDRTYTRAHFLTTPASYNPAPTDDPEA